MPGSDTTPVARLRGAHAWLGGREILHDVDLDLVRGERVALLGVNGVGKSTLLGILAGIRELSAGHVELDGRPARSHGRRARARLVSLATQQLPTAHGWTVGELVALGRTPWLGVGGRRRRSDELAIDDALERLGIAQLRERRIDQLSGGERRLVHLARSVAQQAPLLLLDEPLANLDPGRALDVLAHLETLVAEQGVTVVAALHEPAHAIAWADRVVFMRDGRIQRSRRVDQLEVDDFTDCYQRPSSFLFDAAGTVSGVSLSSVARPG